MSAISSARRIVFLNVVGVLITIGLTAAPSPVAAEVLPFGLKIEKVLENTVELGSVAQSPTGELWLLDRTLGRIRVFEAGELVATSPALVVDAACQSGLLDVAFDPDYPWTGLALVSYVDGFGSVGVREVFRTAAGLEFGSIVLDFGSILDRCTPGGGLEVGPDGKLYTGVGDLGYPLAAQDFGSYLGKVLRTELDGSSPAYPVWATGFRNPKALDINPNTARVNGTLYLSELGTAGVVYDEINEIRHGGNYGWADWSGPGGGYDEPLVAYLPTVTPEALATLTGDALGEESVGSLVFACLQVDEIDEARLGGSEYDQFEELRPFFDPDGDRDGTPDPGCPHGVNALEEAADGWLYLAARDANPGLWRIWKDAPGPREVSRPGTPFPLTVDEDGMNLVLGWEHLGPLDAGLPARNGGQHGSTYRIWEGSLPISGVYDHTRLIDTDGDAVGPARREFRFTPEAGSRYYLVSAQGDNLEGSLGAASNGTARPGPEDYCESIGYGNQVGDCADEWRDPNDGTVLDLVDYNPRSPTYGHALSMSDFRGRAVRLSLLNQCGHSQAQADQFSPVDVAYRDRDLSIVTVLTAGSCGDWPIAFPPSECASVIEDWATAHDLDTPILCDVGEPLAFVSMQYVLALGYLCRPLNLDIDQGHVIHRFVCNADSSAEIEAIVQDEVNPESCE